MNKTKIWKLILVTLLVFALFPTSVVANAMEYYSDDIIIEGTEPSTNIDLIVADGPSSTAITGGDIVVDTTPLSSEPAPGNPIVLNGDETNIGTFVISEIDYDDVVYPEDGESPQSDVSITIVNDVGEKESIDTYTVKWTDKKGKEVVEFAYGKTYYISISFKVDGDYKLDSDYTAFLGDRAVYTSFSNKAVTLNYCFENIGETAEEFVSKFIFSNEKEVNYLIESGNVTPIPSLTEEEEAMFEGWYKDANYSAAANTSTPFTADVTFYGKFKTEHNTQFVEEVPATCEMTGVQSYWRCSDCGLLFSDKDAHFPVEYDSLIIPALGHNWGDWFIAVSPTCEEYGLYQRNCSRDASHVETQEIEPTGHNYGDWVTVIQATCEQDGTQSRTCFNNSSHVESRPIPAIGHSWSEWYVQTPATCLADGVQRRVCFNDPSHVEYQSIPAIGHAWGEWFVDKQATCKKEGVEKRVCENDRKHYETRTIPKTEHSWTEWTVSKNATEKSEGESVRKCTICGEKEKQTIPKLNHVHRLNYVAEVPATCDKDGSVGYYICSGCNKRFSDASATWELQSVVMPALGHNWGAWQVSKAATTTSEGEQFRVCQRNSSHVEKAPIAKLPSYSNTNTNQQTSTTTQTQQTQTQTPSSSITPTVTPAISTAPTNGEKNIVNTDGVVNQNWSNSKDSTIVITSQVPYTKFRAVTLDNQTVDKKNYIATAGAGNKTQVVLTSNYLATLKNGAHTVVIEGENEKSSTEITISGNPVTNGMNVSAQTSPSPTPSQGQKTNGNTSASPTTAKKSRSPLALILALAFLTLICVGVIYVTRIYLPRKQEEERQAELKKKAQLEKERKKKEEEHKRREEERKAEKAQLEMERIAREVASQVVDEKHNSAAPIAEPSVIADSPAVSAEPETMAGADKTANTPAKETDEAKTDLVVEDNVKVDTHPVERGRHEAGAEMRPAEIVHEEQQNQQNFSIDAILAEFHKDN